MLRHRVILGLPLAALFIGLIAIDWFAAGGWPLADWSTPPGLLMAGVCAIVIPLGLWEMRGLLARQNVHISIRITVLASLLCMMWPWLGQFGDSIQERMTWPSTDTIELKDGRKVSGLVWRTGDVTTIKTDDGKVVTVTQDAIAKVTGVPPPNSPERIARLKASPWHYVGTAFSSVKPHYFVPTVLAAALLAAVVKHSRDRRVQGAMANAGGTLLAIVYLGVLPDLFLPICMTHSAWMMFGIVAIVKFADVGAFATGKLLGKHKLIPWLSPGKTIEGFLGGLLLAGIVGAVFSYIMKTSPAVNPQDELRWGRIDLAYAILGGGLSGILLGAVGQVGDLLESLLKRDAGVKDSGAVPGFGGVLDILDSPLLAAPVAYWLLKLVLR